MSGSTSRVKRREKKASINFLIDGRIEKKNVRVVNQARKQMGTSCPTYRPYHVTYGQTVMNKIQHPMMMKREETRGDTQNTKIEQATRSEQQANKS